MIVEFGVDPLGCERTIRLEGEAAGELDEDGAKVTPDAASARELLRLFDAPAFVRRGQDAEFAVAKLREKLTEKRSELLDMVRLRLKQWAGVVTCVDDYRIAFVEPIDELWSVCSAEPPNWGDRLASPRKIRAVAGDLAFACARFNTRWAKLLSELDVGPVNRTIDLYNRYYVLEKECVLGSTRLAARHFSPLPRYDLDRMLAEHPLLHVPVVIG